MLFLALLPADMLPPAGHRAGPGRAHTGPIGRSGQPGGGPALSRAPPRCGGRGSPGCPTKSPKLLPRLPAPPRTAGPATGAWDREAGLAPARKVSAGEIPAWSRRGEATRSAPRPGRDPQEILCPAPRAPYQTSRLRGRPLRREGVERGSGLRTGGLACTVRPVSFSWDPSAQAP